MKDYLLERPGLVIGFILAVIFLAIAEPWKKFGSSKEAATETLPKSSPRIEQANKLRYQQPDAALALVQEILAAPQDSKETEAARALLPELWESAFFKFARANQIDEGRPIMDRLLKEFPGHRATLSVRSEFGRKLGEQIQAAARAGESTRVQKLFQDYTQNGFHLPRKGPNGETQPGESSVLETYARFQLGRWKALAAADRNSGGGLEVAAEGFGPILEHNSAFQMLRLLQEEQTVTGEQLLGLSQTFQQQGLLPQAFNTLFLANAFLASGKNWQAPGQRELDYQRRKELSQKNSARLAELALALSSQLETNPSRVLTSMTTDAFLKVATGYLDAHEQRAALIQERLRLALNEYLAASEPLLKRDIALLAQGGLAYETEVTLAETLHQAQRRKSRIEDELRPQLFDTLCQSTNAALWSNVPLTVYAEIQAALPRSIPPAQAEQFKRDQLRKMVGEGRAANPVETSPAYETRRIQVAAVQGVHLLQSNREEAFRELRFVRHQGGDDTLKNKLKTAVETALRRSRKEEKFDALIELAGFYAAEFGEAMGAFRDEFRAALESSAGTFKSRQNMRYVFVQALLSSAFAGEEIGRKAQEETIQQAFAIVENVPVERNFSAVKARSQIPGWSTVAVNNSTEHHILLVYDGSEKFAVLCNPQRKGSFPLKNGAYRLAVMTPLGNIRPYRAERNLIDEHAPADYRIEISGKSQAPAGNPMSGNAYGDYTLLRAHAELSNAQVDPRTGIIALR